MKICCKAIMVKIFSAIMLFLLLGCTSLFSQVDSVEEKRSKNDTSLTFEERTENLLENLKEYARNKDNLLAIALRNVLVLNSDKKAEARPEKPAGREQELEGYTIAGVQIEVLDVFGPGINDPERDPKNWLERTANKTHYNTRSWHVRNFLLFETGDKLDPLEISESERLLRTQPYILDSRILIDSVDTASKQVFLKVYTKDIWSITGSASGSLKGPAGVLSATESNFLGLGHRVNSRVRADPALPRGWKYSGNYLVSNIGNSYINGRLYYDFREPEYITRRYGINFGRGFYSPTAKWAGGVTLQKTEADAYYTLNDSVLHHDEYQHVAQDIWAAFAGRSPFSQKNSQGESRMIYGIRASRLSYLERPVVTGAPDHSFNNSLLLLGSIGYSSRSYVKSSYIFGFGRTEDIPVGGMAALVGGYEFAETYQRPYIGFYSGLGKYSEETGYWRFGFNAGSFIRNGQLNLGVASAELFYFTNLIPLGRVKWRQYLLQRITYGINRKDWEHVGISRELGLRGLRSALLTGKQKFVINYESNFFLPGNYLGFNIAVVTFADLAWLGDEGAPIFTNRMYQGYGVGLRIKNEHLVFNTIQVLFAYYPGVLPDARKNFSLLTSEQGYYRFRDFEFSHPSIVPYH